MLLHTRSAILNTLLDAGLSGESILLSNLITKFKTHELIDEDWINFNAALQRAPQAAKDEALKEFLSEIPSFGKRYWGVTDNPLITLKINGCRFDHQPLPDSDLTTQQYLLYYSDRNEPTVVFLMRWLVNETGLDCAPFIPDASAIYQTLYQGPTTMVREIAIQSGCQSLYSIVLDIPHVPLPDAIPEASRAIFPQHTPHQGNAEYITMFLQYPGNVVDVIQ